MACPQCGSTEREPIAPGLWECHGQIRIEHTFMVPNEAGPRGPYGQPLMMRPAVQTRVEACLNRYQEGPSAVPNAPKCACGTYAIGECADCVNPVCGDCSARRTGRRLCMVHARAFDEIDRERQAREGAAAAEVRRTAAEARRTADEAARVERLRVEGEARDAHARRVSERERFAPTPAVLSARRDWLNRQLAKGHGVSGFAVFAWILLVVVFGSQAAIGIGVWAWHLTGEKPEDSSLSISVAVAAWLLIWAAVVTGLARRARRRRMRSEWQRELADLPYRRGCGDRGCRSCHAT